VRATLEDNGSSCCRIYDDPAQRPTSLARGGKARPVQGSEGIAGPAVAAYHGTYLPYGIVVLTATTDGISRITAFGFLPVPPAPRQPPRGRFLFATCGVCLCDGAERPVAQRGG